MSIQSEITRITGNIASAFTAIGSKGGTVPSSQVSGNLATAIHTIPTGITVQRASGSFTTNTSGNATVNCGFQPDTVIVTGFIYAGIECQLGANFEVASSDVLGAVAWQGDDLSIIAELSRSTNGFTVSGMKQYTLSWDESTISRKSYNYVAIKYTD